MAEKLDEVDVVIVGSGWAGGITAAELSKKGYKVVGLERGKAQKTEDFIGAKDELRYGRRKEMFKDFTKETFTVRNDEENTALPLRLHANTLIDGDGTGGTAMHWSGLTYRFLPYDFEIYSQTVERYGEGKIPEGMLLQDWGITYDELEPYYDQFEKTAGISGEENPLGPWRSDEYPTPPMKETPITRLFTKAANDLGYHPYRIPSANMSESYENPDGETINACVYCSFCTLYGCDFGAKSDPVVTVLSTAKKTGNYELRNNAYVTRILHDGNRATGVLYTDVETGQEYEQPADLVVLGAFIFSNTRLLLLSEIGEPYDPSTGRGVIGKNFTGHYSNLTYTGVTGFFEDKKFNNFAGAGSLGTTLDDFNAEQLDHNELDFLHGFQLYIRQTGDTPISNNDVPYGIPTWGKEFKEKSLYYTNRKVTLEHMEGVMPWQHNYMDLDPMYTDFAGNPLLRITAKFTDQERNITRHAYQQAEKMLKQMGADIVNVPEITDDTELGEFSVGNHSAGGAIMGNDPETSAVNNYSQM